MYLYICFVVCVYSVAVCLLASITAVDVCWLGVHHGDLFDDAGRCKVAPEALQSWALSDNKVFTGLRSLMDASEKVSAACTCMHAFFKYGCSYVEGGNINIDVLLSLLLDGVGGYGAFSVG